MNEPTHCNTCGVLFEPRESLKLQCPTCMLMGAFPELAGSSGIGSRPFEPPSIEELQSHFGEYEFMSLAGRGGMSAVYKARQTNLDRVVAIKILPVEVAESTGGLERFLREAKALAQISHPNIVSIHSFGEADKWCYFVMEYVEGCTLRQIIGDGDLEESSVLQMVESICAALQYAHERGVVHRDIKPENVLLDREGNIRIVDFGLAKPLGRGTGFTRATATNQIVGTPHYLAPEQVHTPTKVDQRADLYSLGVVIYEMLTGRLPLGNFDPPSSNSQRKPGWDQVVMRALSANPAQRYEHAKDMHAALSSIDDAPPATVATHVDSSFDISTWLVVAAVVGLLVGAFYFLDSGVRHLRPNDGGVANVNVGLLAFGEALVCLIGALAITGGNVRTTSSAEPLSTPQRILAAIASSFYWLAALLVVLLPAVFILLYAAVPLLSADPPKHWDIFGINFPRNQPHSVTNRYWLGAIGGSALACAGWSVLMSVFSYLVPRKSEQILQPLTPSSVRALRFTILAFAIVVLLPLGAILLFAADSH